MGESVIVPQKIKNRITARCSRPTCGSPPQRPHATLRVLHALKGRHKRSSWSHIGCVYESAENNLRPRALAAAHAQQSASGPKRCHQSCAWGGVHWEVSTGSSVQAKIRPGDWEEQPARALGENTPTISGSRGLGWEGKAAAEGGVG